MLKHLLCGVMLLAGSATANFLPVNSIFPKVGKSPRLGDVPSPRRRIRAVVGSISGGGGGGGSSSVGISDYNSTPVGKLVVNRGGWLAVFLLSLSLTSVVMSGFEHTLAEQIELAYFVPLLIGHGGNAGGQTVSISNLISLPIGVPFFFFFTTAILCTSQIHHDPPTRHARKSFKLPRTFHNILIPTYTYGAGEH